VSARGRDESVAGRTAVASASGLPGQKLPVRRTSQISDELTFKLGAQLEVFWSFNLGSDALTRAMTILLRLLGGGILCVFAYVPAWIGYDAVADAIANPRTIDAT
jgi:hypothetical protein